MLVVSAMALCACETPAQRQFETMRKGDTEALAPAQKCALAVYDSPQNDPLRQHLPAKPADKTLEQVADQSLAAPRETKAISATHA